MRLLPYGDRAVLLEVATTAEALHLHRHLAAIEGVLETVPAARTVLAVIDTQVVTAAEIERAATDIARQVDPPDRADRVTIDVRYDGADLDAIATEVGIGIDELIERHTRAEYVVAFCGFSPGFAYLTGLDPVLRLPRLATPRTSVPAGSVAIAGEFTGVYPRSSPGGWRLIGTTNAVVWDAARTPPALLPPGTVVRFRPA